jgi:5'-AMP-activated protein kinase, regulatory gamma subunit
MLNESAVLQRAGKDAIVDFLRKKTLYDVMRSSGKVVVFDTNIPIQLAFYALLEHDLPSAPLWDSARRVFVGLLSVTDFIDILRHYHRRGIPMEELSARTISEVMVDKDGGRPLQHSTFLGTNATTDIYSAVSTMMTNKHRFLPVVPPGETRVLSIVSYHDVLWFLVNHFREQVRTLFHYDETKQFPVSSDFIYLFSSAKAFRKQRSRLGNWHIWFCLSHR